MLFHWYKVIYEEKNESFIQLIFHKVFMYYVCVYVNKLIISVLTVNLNKSNKHLLRLLTLSLLLQ